MAPAYPYERCAFTPFPSNVTGRSGFQWRKRQVLLECKSWSRIHFYLLGNIIRMTTIFNEDDDLNRKLKHFFFFVCQVNKPRKAFCFSWFLFRETNKFKRTKQRELRAKWYRSFSDLSLEIQSCLGIVLIGQTDWYFINLFRYGLDYLEKHII